MNAEYKTLYDKWCDHKKFISVVSVIYDTDEYKRLKEWCENNLDEFNNSILEQLNYGSNWSVQLLQDIYGDNEYDLELEGIYILDTLCEKWIEKLKTKNLK